MESNGVGHSLVKECGSADFKVWDVQHGDFNQCFFHLVLQFPIFGFFCTLSSYYVGKRRVHYSQFYEWNACQSRIIYSRAIIVSLLSVLAVSQFLFHFALHMQDISVTECAIGSTKTLAWILHLIYVLLLKRGNSFNTRGPKSMQLAWFLTCISSALEFRTSYFHFLTLKKYSLLSGEDTAIFSFCAGELILQSLYLLSLIPGTSHLEPRHYRHRSRMNDAVLSAYESQENHSYTGFNEDDEELPLGTAKENSSWLSILLFRWVTPLLKKGACGFLHSPDNLFELPLSLSTRTIASIFQRFTISRGYSLLKALHVCFGLEFYSVGILKLLSDGMGFCGPILLKELVNYIETGSSDKEDVWRGYMYVGGLFISTLIGALSNVHFNMKMAEVNLKIRGALITTIYRKTVHMKRTTLDNFSTGEIINFMSTDTDRIVNFCPSFHAFWSLPAQVAIALYLLYLEIGVAFVAGVVFAIVLIPVNRIIANKIGSLSTTMMQFKDQRVKLMSEILFGIKSLKFHCWESYFFNKVNDIRGKEMKTLKGRKYLDALCVYFWATTPVLVSLMSFGTYVLIGNKLTAAKVFTSIALFNMLISPLNALPWVLNGVVEAWVSIKRINKFLREEESDPGNGFDTVPACMKDEIILLADNCSFAWKSDAGSDLPGDIYGLNLKLHKGNFVGVIGNVGSGKSTLLLALLGELNHTGGTLQIADPSKGIGVVLQEAWIQRGTIKSNICFAPNTNLTKYKAVIDSCCLKEDLDSFKYRDETIVGENGTSLSGGQKVRISLARAVYQDFDVYFLDDIFAAVDYKVAKQIYWRCIMGILKDKTKIICTHHTQFLKNADWILVMDDGAIVDEGLPSTILSKYKERVKDCQGFDDSVSDSDEKEPTRRFSKVSHSASVSPKEPENAIVMSNSFDLSGGENYEDMEGCDLNEEAQHEGKIEMHVFMSYYKAVGPFLFWLIIISMFAMQVTRNLSDVWLAYWVSHSSNNSVPNDTWSTTATPPVTFEATSSYFEEISEKLQHPYIKNTSDYQQMDKYELSVAMDPQMKFYFTVFICIGAANSVFTLFRAFLFALGGILGAIRIHASLLNSILSAKMSFFDQTPVGRILNRFSSDIATIDDSLPFISNILLAQTFSLLGTLALTCYAIPWILIVIIPLLLVCTNIQEYYRHSARQLRRLGSITLSPVYAHFSETLKGLTFIRGMRAVRRFEEINESHLESSQKCQYSTQAVSQWLSFRLQIIGVVIITSVGLLGIFQHHYGIADPGIIGLAISYALTVTNSLNGFINVLTETEKEMVSVERACEYVNDIEKEDIEGLNIRRQRISHLVPFLWPAHGIVKFSGVYLKYRENLPFVLRNVCFETRPAEKIGICGRTGSGKSSLFSALFRIVDIFSGQISIDHVDIKLLSLKTLRSKLCIIPQDPIIFTGSLRENLDPVGDRSDDEIVRALEKCQIRGLIGKLGGLDASLGDAGNLLSSGQKQLLCLARAILINAKILCIDEATANVDIETDQVIQSTLRTSFTHTTVITVAHRVNTIIHCDRVLVMSQGEIVEFDDPTRLLEQHSSLFYQLGQGNV